MNRMTKKNEYGEYQPVEQGKILFDCLNKLGELENIEEEIGIDLITFFKFLNAKVCYEKDPDDNEITKCLITGITKTGVLNVQEAFPYGECEREAKFTEYGKTWALTKEELD